MVPIRLSAFYSTAWTDRFEEVPARPMDYCSTRIDSCSKKSNSYPNFPSVSNLPTEARSETVQDLRALTLICARIPSRQTISSCSLSGEMDMSRGPVSTLATIGEVK